MKKLLIALLAVVAMSMFHAPAAKSQEGLAIGLGYRGFLPTNLSVWRMHGICIGADYAAQDLLGPIDLVAGLNFDRVWNRFSTYPEQILGQYWDGMMTSTDMQIPLNFRVRFGNGTVVPFIAAGAVLNVGLDAKWGTSYDWYMYDLYAEPDLGSANPKNPVGIVFNRVDVLVGGSIGAIFADVFRLKVEVMWGTLNRVVKDEYNVAASSLGIDINNTHNLQLNVTFAYCFE